MRPTMAESAILGLLVASIIAVALGPIALDESYSWVQHSTSEAAGQQVDGAWVTRSGFLLFGLAVLWLTHLETGRWSKFAASMHALFGACLTGVAAFSLRAWDGTSDYDHTEDLLHSVLATAMGFAFAFGVAGVAWTRPGRGVRVIDVVAVAASILIPLAMAASDDYTGALQRVMFGVAYIWYATEVLRVTRSGESSQDDRREAASRAIRDGR